MKPAPQRLTGKQVGGIVKMLGLTAEHELNCGECLQHVSEFAERQLAREPLDEVIARVEQHLALCPECREEYEALMKILKASQ
jgi:uncharacterized protein with PIN domain